MAWWGRSALSAFRPWRPAGEWASRFGRADGARGGDQRFGARALLGLQGRPGAVPARAGVGGTLEDLKM